MFIVVKHGQNESLLCNPSCAVINLLTSIKRRTGYANSNIILDLSDETGLVKELDGHKNEYATNFLNSHATYILVQKDRVLDANHVTRDPAPQFIYTALLQDSANLFPNFSLHVAEVEVEKKKHKRPLKSPSPAGQYPTTKPSTGRSKKSHRSGSRQK